MPSKKKKTRNNDLFNTLVLSLTVFSMSIIPLLVRIISVEYPMDQFSWYVNQTQFYDVFSKIKSEAIVCVGIVALILLIYYYWSIERVNPLRRSSNVMGLSYGILILLSTLFSISTYFSLHGFIERYESVFVLLAYLIVFMLCSVVVWTEDMLKKLMYAFLISNIALSIIGIFQYAGMDLIFNNTVKPLIVSNSIRDLSFDLTKSFDYKAIFQTLYHSNYVGLYISLSLPVFITFFIYEKKSVLKNIYLLTSILILFNLIGSISRGGIIGVALGVPVFLLLNRRKLYDEKKAFIAFLLVIIIVALGFETYSGGFMMTRFRQIFTNTNTVSALKRIQNDENQIVINYNESQVKVDILEHEGESWTLKYYLDDQEILPAGINDEGHVYFENEKLKNISLFLYMNNDEVELAIVIDKTSWTFGYDDNQLKYKNIYSKFAEIEDPKVIGFDNMEKIGSARGYIWSRSLPRILERPFLGYGPETFPLAFPQNDYVGKYRAYGTTNMMVDKPHNLYLQIAISTGLISLLVFGALIFNNFRRVFRISQMRKRTLDLEEDYAQVLLYGFTVSIFSFLVTSFFADSNVHVSIVFWVILGLSYSITCICNTQAK